MNLSCCLHVWYAKVIPKVWCVDPPVSWALWITPISWALRLTLRGWKSGESKHAKGCGQFIYTHPKCSLGSCEAGDRDSSSPSLDFNWYPKSKPIPRMTTKHPKHPYPVFLKTNSGGQIVFREWQPSEETPLMSSIKWVFMASQVGNMTRHPPCPEPAPP